MSESTERPGLDRTGDNTRRIVRSSDPHSRRLPIHQADRPDSKKNLVRDEGGGDIVIPKLPLVTDQQHDQLASLVDGRPERLRVLQFLLELESNKIRSFVRQLLTLPYAEEILARLATKRDDELREDLQASVTGSDAMKIAEELRQRTQGTRQTVKEVVKKEESVDIDKVPHRIENLLEIADPQERKKAVRAVFELMQQHSFRNMSADDRAKYGCIYHVSPTLEELERHISKAVLYPVIRRTDTGRIFSFCQVEKGRRIRKLNSARKIRHKENGKLDAILRTPEEKILHEQLIVVDRHERFAGAKIKGAGTKLLKWCFDKAREMGIVVFTTEVQSGNNRSGGFHIEVGYKYVGQIEERPAECDPVQFDIFVLDLRKPGQQDRALTRNDSPTPTVEGS